MKRLALAALGLALAAPAAAQTAQPSVSDVPTGRARVVGTVLRADDGRPVPDAEVALYALPAGGLPGVRRTRSDAAGRFAFEGISADPAVAYLVGARHEGIPFPGDRLSFRAGESERSVEIRVTGLTRDAAKLSVRETTLRIEWAGDRLLVDETHVLRNDGARTIYVPAGARAERDAPFRARLPDGADGFRAPLGVTPEGLERRGADVLFYGPLYPGEQQVSFSYALPAAPGRVQVTKTLPPATQRFVVQTPESGPPLEAARLAAGEPAVLGGRRYRQHDAAALAPGSRVAFSVELPPLLAARDAVGLAEVRLFLEYDDAVLLVREEHRLEVSGAAWVVAPEGEPLLRIPLPDGAEDVRFADAAFAWGLGADPDGGIALGGPLPPGESVVEIAYRVPLAAPSAHFERRFARSLPLLSMFVVDTGLLAESDRLHRRRPVRSGKQTFLHLEAFEVGPSEPVRLTLTPLPARSGLPRPVVVALVAVGAVLATAILTAPLRRATPESEPAASDESASQRERDALYEAMRDLEHDHETGKISDEDYETLRRQLRGRAVALMRTEPRSEPPARAHPESNRCAACGAEPRAEDRFCARCGANLLASEREASA